MKTQLYIGIMSGTSMDGADAVLIQMHGAKWQRAIAHAFVPYTSSLKTRLLELQNIGDNELHRSQMLAIELSEIYAQVVQKILQANKLQPENITAIGCHGQTVRHAPEHGYSVQLANLPLLAERTGIFTIGDFRSRDLAAGGQGAPLVPAFHQALFAMPTETRVVLNIGGIANISVLPPNGEPFGFDTGAGNMLMDAWTQHIWQQLYDKNGAKALRGRVLPELLAQLKEHEYFRLPYPKSTGRELFSLDWLYGYLHHEEDPFDVLRTLVQFTADTIADAIFQAAPNTQNVYVCGGGIGNETLICSLKKLFAPHKITVHSTEDLQLNPQWVEAAAFAWLAACWVNRTPSNPHKATGANKPLVLGAGHYA
ncbi:anhydro-N-acetylmuramic acid kinase [Kingella negevensis]|uniref:anhydro-N-acetylmuramic acid kinase n=1 Tax=Kingella negevensis TaxID=1522312 RepID=UPI00050A0618|nr:anhydro-N-acetylmuramic acid kinase [Kingella negevensis]MDK4688636.1 anhydro-N-acetylmuramic acid kinase [Kingella negevensis]WII91620.1 anhydro-N-acetylmuramic acid kinase [Kingella negevensis]